MEGIRHFTNIPAAPNWQRISHQLASGSRRDVGGGQAKARYGREAAYVHSLVQLQGVWCPKAAVRLRVNIIELGGGTHIISRNLAELLGHRQHLLLLACTAGGSIDEAVQEALLRGEAHRAVVWDALAADLVLQGMDWLLQSAAAALRSVELTPHRRRLAVGFGDFALTNQGWLLEELQLEKLGIRNTASHALVPSKTATAVVPLQRLRSLSLQGVERS